MYTTKGFEINQPIVIKKDGHPFSAIEICENGLILWKYENGTYKFHQGMNFSVYKSKIILIADLVKQIMLADKYCTLY